MSSDKKNIISSHIILENLIRHTQQYIFWKDKDSIFRGCNHTFAKLVGYENPDDIIGLTDNDFGWSTDGFDARFFRSRDKDVIQGKEIVNLEQVISAPNGRNITVLTNKTPIYNSENDIIGVLVIAFDITDKKQYEREILRLKNRADLANRAKSEFIANMSHDIRTPLSGMIGMAEEISTTTLDNHTIKNYAGKLVNAGNKLLYLMNEILEMTRLERGDFITQDVSFSVSKLLEDIRDLMLPSIEEKSLNFIIQYDKNIPPTLYGKYTLVHRVLLNLVSNAIKFSSKGQIKISARLLMKNSEKATVLLAVEDTGIGISEDQQQSIFQPFNRIKPAYENADTGAGLGLYIVKQLLKLLGSEIQVKSTENKGSKFSFEMTVLIGKLDSSTNTLSKTKPLYTIDTIMPDGKALIVEDDPLARQAALLKLQTLYSSVDVVSKGSEAIIQLREIRYDVIYLDIGLPDISGYTVVEELRKYEQEKNLPHTLIVTLTAHATDEISENYRKKGIDLVLTKPLSLEAAKRIRTSGLSTFDTVAKTKNSFQNDDTLRDEAPNEIINLKLATQIAGNEKIAREIVAMLSGELAESKENLQVSFTNKDWEEFRKIVHKMHGSVGYCGAEQLNTILMQLEDDLLEAHPRVDELYEELLLAIDQFLEASKKLGCSD